MRLGSLLITALTLLLLSPASHAKSDLEPGDTAPGLSIEEWLNGSEISLEEGTVYLVHFFQPKEGRVQETVERLSETQDELGHRNLVVLGITDEKSEEATRFVTARQDTLQYTVGVDRRGVTTREWKKKAKPSGSSLFIVDRHLRIAWIGSPTSDEWEKVLHRVLRGRFNAKLEEEARPLLRAAERNRKIKNWREAKRYYDQVIELDHTVFADVALERFEMMLVDMDDPEAAYTYLRGTLMGQWYAKDPNALQDIAELITTDPDIPAEQRDLDLALQAAREMRRLADRRDWAALETLAMVHFHRGEFDEAVRWQKKAWMTARPKHKAELKRQLVSYQHAEARKPGNE